MFTWFHLVSPRSTSFHGLVCTTMVAHLEQNSRNDLYIQLMIFIFNKLIFMFNYWFLYSTIDFYVQRFIFVLNTSWSGKCKKSRWMFFNLRPSVFCMFNCNSSFSSFLNILIEKAIRLEYFYQYLLFIRPQHISLYPALKHLFQTSIPVPLAFFALPYSAEKEKLFIRLAHEKWEILHNFN